MNAVVLIIVISSLILIGIISFIVDLNEIRKTQRKILDYRNVVLDFYEKFNKGKNVDEEWSYILSNYKEVFRLMTPHCYQPSTYDLVSSVLNHRHSIDRDVACLEKEIVSTIADYDREFQRNLSQWWNIFSHFFRGIGTTLRIVFQYPIKMINPNFDFNSKAWNLFCAIIGVLGSIASILSLCFQR